MQGGLIWKKYYLFYSGGNDSTLAAFKLALEGYEVNLVTFDNGCERGLENLQYRAGILEKIFAGKVVNLGVYNTIGSFIKFKHECANVPFSNMLEEYGDLNINQLNCLNCRSAMYAVGIKLALELKINHIAEGARKTQYFALEQKPILEAYNKILNEYNLDLILPVFDYESDNKVKYELYNYSKYFLEINNKKFNHYEALCLLGMPMDRKLTKEEIEAYKKYFDRKIKQLINNEVNTYPDYVIKEYIKKPTFGEIKLK